MAFSRDNFKKMEFNQNSGYGNALLSAVAAQIPAFGRLLVVMNPTDVGSQNFQALFQIMKEDPFGRVRFFFGTYAIEDAYAEAETNNNDVICLDAHTSHKVSAMLTVAKNRVHFIGFDGGGRISNQRVLISNTGAGAATDVSMIKITGTGCSFRNIAFKNNWTVAQNLSAVLDYGSNSLFKNCSLQNLGSAHLTNANCAPLILAAGDSEYHQCNIGADTLQSTVVAGQVILIKKGTSSQAATRCLFKECLIRAYTNKTTHAFVRTAAEGDIDRDVTFKDCDFVNFLTVNNGALMAVAVVSSATSDGGNTYYSGCRVFGTTDFATAAVGNVGVIVCGGTTPTAGSDGVAVQATA